MQASPPTISPKGFSGITGVGAANGRPLFIEKQRGKGGRVVRAPTGFEKAWGKTEEVGIDAHVALMVYLSSLLPLSIP